MDLKIILELLGSRRYILTTDEDQPIVQTVRVEFDHIGNLLAIIETTDYEDHDRDSYTIASVRRSDAVRMARRLRVPYKKLTDFIADCLCEWGDIVNADFDQAQACFKEIVECLIDEGCRLRIRRKFGKGGAMSC